jgi:hypothetical protein
LEDKITLLKAMVEDEGLGIPQVDIIISEWMGFFLLYEAMLDSVIYARDKYLKKHGLMFPERAKLFIAAMDDEVYRKKKFGFFNDNRYKLNLSAIMSPIEKIVYNDTFPIYQILSDLEGYNILDINLNTVKVADLDFVTNYEMRVDRD